MREKRMRLDIQRTVAIVSEKKRVDVGAPISIIVNRERLVAKATRKYPTRGGSEKSYNSE